MENFVHENGTLCFAADSDTIDRFAEKMIEFNKMQYIASCSYDDDKSTIYYDVKGMAVLKNILQISRKPANALDIIDGICSAMKEARQYMLNDRHLIFDERFIFINPENNRVVMLYAPIKNSSDDVDISGLMKRIIASVKQDGEILQPISVILDTEPFSIKLVENILLEMTSDNDNQLHNDEPGIDEIPPNEPPVGNAYIIRKSTGEKIEITGTNFIVGKSPEYAKYVIRNNRAISRVHATFIIRNGTYYIADNDSKNGTFVNGQKIDFENMAELCDGDTIQLANEKFKFAVKN